MEQIEEICAALGVPGGSAEPLRGGTASRVWRLRFRGEDYLLRSPGDRERGAKERTILRHLRFRGFQNAPELLGETEREGACYQLLPYLPGTMPDLSLPGTAGRIGALVRALTEALSDCPPISGGDPFDLKSAWRASRQHWDALGTGVPLASADEAAERCAALPERERRVIHGDLGPWNLLDFQGELYVIDFGEARMGDPCFDFAAALGGILNHSPEERREALCREYLAALGAEEGPLLDQLRLWSWRGLVQCAGAAGAGSGFARFAGRFLSALRWGEELLGGNDAQL